MPEGGTGRLREYVDDLRHNSERRSYASFDTETADQIADDLEELVRSVDPETDDDRPLGLGPCETCGEEGEKLGESIRFVKYLPANDAAEDHADLAPARPVHGIVCWECGTPRGFITRDEKRRIVGGDQDV